jgi:hypothetical protein
MWLAVKIAVNGGILISPAWPDVPMLKPNPTGDTLQPSPSSSNLKFSEPPIFFDEREVARRDDGWEDMLEHTPPLDIGSSRGAPQPLLLTEGPYCVFLSPDHFFSVCFYSHACLPSCLPSSFIFAYWVHTLISRCVAMIETARVSPIFFALRLLFIPPLSDRYQH